MNNQKE